MTETIDIENATKSPSTVSFESELYSTRDVMIQTSSESLRILVIANYILEEMFPMVSDLIPRLEEMLGQNLVTVLPSDEYTSEEGKVYLVNEGLIALRALNTEFKGQGAQVDVFSALDRLCKKGSSEFEILRQRMGILPYSENPYTILS